MSARRWVFVFAVMSGCPAADPPAEGTTDAGTTAASSATATSLPTTGGEDTTDEGTTTASSDTVTSLPTTGGEDTTTGSTASGARVLYFVVADGAANASALRLVDDTDANGPTAAADLLTAPPGGVLDTTADLSPQRRWLAVHARDAEGIRSVTMVDLHDLQSAPIDLPGAPKFFDAVTFSPDETMIVTVAGTDALELHLCTLDQDGGCATTAWSPPGTGSVQSDIPAFSPDGSRIAYGVEGPGGGGLLLLADTSVPGVATLLADFPATTANFPVKRFTADGGVLYFSVDELVNFDYDYYAVDLTTDPPGQPVKLSPPAALDSRGLLGPDLRGLLWWDGDGVYGDYSLIPLDGLDAGPAIALTAVQPTNGRSGARWSPDGNTIAFQAWGPQYNADDIYVVDVSGPTPADPVRINDPVTADGTTVLLAFAPDATHIVYLAELDAMSRELFLAPIDPPAPPVSLGGPWAGIDNVFDVQYSGDLQRLAFRAPRDSADTIEVYLVDLSGPAPGPPQKLNQPLAPGGGVASPFGFADDGERIYFLASDAPDAPALFRVALAAPGDALRLSDPDEIVASPLVLPPAQ